VGTTKQRQNILETLQQPPSVVAQAHAVAAAQPLSDITNNPMKATPTSPLPSAPTPSNVSTTATTTTTSDTVFAPIPANNAVMVIDDSDEEGVDKSEDDSGEGEDDESEDQLVSKAFQVTRMKLAAKGFRLQNDPNGKNSLSAYGPREQEEAFPSKPLVAQDVDVGMVRFHLMDHLLRPIKDKEEFENANTNVRSCLPVWSILAIL
jgi:hypothetical protein